MEPHRSVQGPATVVAQLRTLMSGSDVDALRAVAGLAADTIERLVEDEGEAAMLLDRLSALLRAVADVLHGGPLAGGLWSWHDLPERAATAVGELEQLRVERSASSLLLAARDAELAALRVELESQRAEAEADEERAYAVASVWRQRWLETLVRFGGIPEMPLSVGEVGGCTCQRFDSESRTHTYRNAPCSYHEAAERQPWNHHIPWNCPTYFDGCNCDGGPYFYEAPALGGEDPATGVSDRTTR